LASGVVAVAVSRAAPDCRVSYRQLDVIMFVARETTAAAAGIVLQMENVFAIVARGWTHWSSFGGEIWVSTQMKKL